jgi:enamine deaminase RidA (YjgF/YER057c/UK114 family)
MSVMLVTMGSVITHFFWSPLQQEQLADGRKVRFGTRSGRYGRDVEKPPSMLRLRYPLWVFASSARASSVAYAETESGASWCMDGRSRAGCAAQRSAAACYEGALTPDGPVLAAQDSKLRRSYSPDTRASPKEEAMQSAHAASIDTLDTQMPEERLRALGIELPPAPPAVGDYTPTVIAGNLLFMSGQLPWIAGDLKFKGKMGAELNIEQGYQAFRLSALNAISQLKAALGNLDRVKQIVRLEGTMGCAPGFHDQPKVLDGASHIVNQVFGPRGRHTRMLYSNNEMPLDCATLVVLTAEIMPR